MSNNCNGNCSHNCNRCQDKSVKQLLKELESDLSLIQFEELKKEIIKSFDNNPELLPHIDNTPNFK